MTVVEVGILVIVLLVVQGIGLWFLFGRGKEKETGNSDGLLLLQQNIQDLAKTLDARVATSSQQMQEEAHRRHTESSRLIKEITQEITSVKEIGRQTSDFAKQLQSLQDILKNPKQRGVL